MLNHRNNNKHFMITIIIIIIANLNIIIPAIIASPVQDFHRREESFKLHEKSFNQVVDNELEQKTRGRRRWS